MKNAFARVASALLVTSIASVAMAQDAAAPLATVKPITGNVLVSTPDGYKPVTADMPLKAGDRLMVLEGGEVTLAYSGGCDDVVNTTSIYTVPVASPCPAVAAAAAGATTPTSTAASTGGGIGGVTTKDALIGAGILVGAAAVGVALDNDDEKPVSP
jgi:hypothetical protein